ncbi:MAG: protein kinase [Chloracidobacterium sp.]|nr:protein kinase [Chloracidobacterium sp.]MDW8218438.1 protein kinase [Acidobacteriota bacterium]
MTFDQSSLVGHTIDGKVRLEAILGQGGMGAVYRGRHLLLGRTVAVKVLRPETLTVEGALERFFREARMAAATEHPNIVTVYDFGQLPDGGAYLVLEFVEGRGLRSLLQEQRVLPPSLALPILGEVCAAVEFAHRRNVIHRDLKPDNIMLKRRDDGSATVKVLDFGLAKTLEEAETSSSITRTGELVGTPAYMSPEHCTGEELDARSDLYSLGIIAYEMLCGQPPFRGRVAAILTAQIQQPPTPLRELNPNLPATLEAAVMSALAKKPAERPASVAEWWARLEAAYVSAYGEKPSATILLPPPPAAAVTAVAAASGVASQPVASGQSPALRSGGALPPRSDTGTGMLGAQARLDNQPAPPSHSSVPASVPIPRVETGTLAIGALPAQVRELAQESVTAQTVVRDKALVSRLRLERFQRVGLVVGGALALVAVGGLAATNWMRSATTPVSQPPPNQPSAVTLPVEASPTSTGTPAGLPTPPPAVETAEASPTPNLSPNENVSRRSPSKARANADTDRPLSDPGLRSGNDSRPAYPEPPSPERAAPPPTAPPRPPSEAQPPANTTRPTSPPASRPQPEAGTARNRSDERRQEQNKRRWWEFWKIGRDKDKDKSRRPRD